MADYWPAKDPNDILDYSIDFADWLGTDTLATVTWTVPTGLTKGSQSNSSTVALVWLSGGTAGATYEVLCRITTAGGRTHDKSVKLRVAEL
jgi:hypothetical protein